MFTELPLYLCTYSHKICIWEPRTFCEISFLGLSWSSGFIVVGLSTPEHTLFQPTLRRDLTQAPSIPAFKTIPAIGTSDFLLSRDYYESNVSHLNYDSGALQWHGESMRRRRFFVNPLIQLYAFTLFCMANYGLPIPFWCCLAFRVKLILLDLFRVSTQSSSKSNLDVDAEFATCCFRLVSFVIRYGWF